MKLTVRTNPSKSEVLILLYSWPGSRIGAPLGYRQISWRLVAIHFAERAAADQVHCTKADILPKFFIVLLRSSTDRWYQYLADTNIKYIIEMPQCKMEKFQLIIDLCENTGGECKPMFFFYLIAKFPQQQVQVAMNIALPFAFSFP